MTTTEQLAFVVGSRAAARLAALKSRLGDTNEERMMEYTDKPTPESVMVTVVKVVLRASTVPSDQPFTEYYDYVEFSCGHGSYVGHDEPNATLVGATTACYRCTDAAKRIAALG